MTRDLLAKILSDAPGVSSKKSAYNVAEDHRMAVYVGQPGQAMIVADVGQCTLGNGAQIAEQIDSVDDANHTYSYRILESPLPLQDYRSTIRVVDSGGGCCVEWTASFDVTDGPAEDTVAMIKGVYDAGMGALRESFAG